MSRIEELEAAVSAAAAYRDAAKDDLSKAESALIPTRKSLSQAEKDLRKAKEALKEEQMKEQGPLETINLVEIDPWSPIAVQWNGEQDNERINRWLISNNHGNFSIGGKRFYYEYEDGCRGYLYPGDYIALTTSTEAELFKDMKELSLYYEIASKDVDKA